MTALAGVFGGSAGHTDGRRSDWVVSVFNNHGVPPKQGVRKTPPQVDATQVRRATITLPARLGKVRRVRSWWEDKTLRARTTKEGTTLDVALPGGGAEAFEFALQE